MTATILVHRRTGADEAVLTDVAGSRTVLVVPEVSEQVCRARGIEPRDVEAVLGATPADDLSVLPHLRWVHSAAAGADGWLRGTLPAGVVLTSAAGNGAIPLAEHAMMLMLMLSRDAPRWWRAQAEHRWDRFSHGELAGATLGIIGYGNSGRDLAVKARAFGMDVQALRHTRTGDSDGPVRLHYGGEGLAELLAASDFVVVTAPLTESTRDLIGARQLAMMRSTAFLVVVSRGGIVSEPALVEALATRRLAGAGLDAHSMEPLPAESPLWDLPNVIITPHNGATTPGTARRGREILLDNLSRWVAGRSLRNVVEVARGY